MINRKDLRQPNSSSFAEIPNLPKDATPENVMEKLDELIDYVNFFNKSISLTSNFDGFIAEIKFGAAGIADGSDKQQIEHFLGTTPKYRIILRQTGNGVLEDIPSEWNSRIVTLKNRGSEAATATILIARE